jgi:hypothetical protein
VRTPTIGKNNFKKQHMNTAKLFQTQSLIIILLLFSACSKQNPCNGSNYTPKTFNYLIDDNTKAQIPYTGNETLTFISNQGDTAILNGQGKNNYMKKTTKNSVTSIDCPEYDNYNFEYVDVEYKGTNSNLSNLFYRVFANEYRQLEASAYLNNSHYDYNAYLSYYNNNSLYTYPVVCGNKTLFGRKILGEKDTDPFFIYNKSYGIIQIQIDSNLIYTLTL